MIAGPRRYFALVPEACEDQTMTIVGNFFACRAAASKVRGDG